MEHSTALLRARRGGDSGAVVLALVRLKVEGCSTAECAVQLE